MENEMKRKIKGDNERKDTTTTTLKKEQIEKMLRSNPTDPRFSFRENEKSRSDVWCKFRVVFYENVQLPFAHCKDCGSILSYSGKIGTASLLRHKCYLMAQLNTKKISEITISAAAAVAAAATVTAASVDNRKQLLASPISSSTFSESFPTQWHHFQHQHLAQQSNFNNIHGAVLLENSAIPDSVISSIAQRQIGMVVNDLQSIVLMEGDGFKSFAQSLINLGADYGRHDIDNVLSKQKGLEKTILPALYAQVKSDIKDMLQDQSIALSLEIWEDDDFQTKKHYFTLSAHLIEDFEYKKFTLGTRELEFITTEKIQEKVLNILSEFFVNPHEILETSKIVTDNCPELLTICNTENWLLSSCDCLNMILDEFFSENSVLSEISTIVAACKSLIQHLDDNGLNRQLRKQIIFQNSTHWDSVFMVLETISKQYQQLQELLGENRQQYMIMDANEILTTLLHFLELFKHCYESLSCEDEPTLNEVVLWKYKILNYLTMNETDLDLIKLLKSKMKEVFEEKFVLQDIHYIALFLDPDFKGMKFLSRSQRHKIINKVSEIIKNEIYVDQIDESDEYVTKMRKICREDWFAEFRDSNSDIDEPHVKEVRQYVYQNINKMNILEFWKNASNFPRLQKLAIKTLNIPSSSSCCNREIPYKSKMLNYGRKRVIFDDYDMILFLHQNRKT